MLNQFSRTELLYGKEAMERLANARVAIFGLGGVGGYTAEALARSGVGTFDLIDDDKVCLTNLNRQIIATRKTVGKQKVEVMRDRIMEINPHARIHLHNCFYLPDQRDLIDFETADRLAQANGKNRYCHGGKRSRSTCYLRNGSRKQDPSGTV